MGLPLPVRAGKLQGVPTESPRSSVDVSVVRPVYNEAGHLATEVDRIRAALEDSPYRYEILVVDDGSTDGGPQELADLEGVRRITFHRNRGSGAARQAGTALAQGEIVVWTDVDMTYPNHQIPELVDNLAGWDMVVGARQAEQGTRRLVRIPAKWLIRKLAAFLVRTRIPDLNSGFRAFRKTVADQYMHLLPSGFSCVTTLTMSFLSNGYSVRYVPIDYAPRAGKSKFHWWKDTLRYLRQVVRMVLLWDPFRFFAPFGVVVGLGGMGKLVYDLVTKDLRVATNTIVLLIIAALFLLIALVTDLLVQLNRPRYTVLPAYTAEPDQGKAAEDPFL